MRRRILIVEDNERVAEVCRLALAAEGCAVWVGRDGAEAMRAVETYASDLVVLDIELAGAVDGFTVLSWLRGWTDAVRVMIVSGHGTATDLVRGLRDGADEYVVKPVSRAACTRAAWP